MSCYEEKEQNALRMNKKSYQFNWKMDLGTVSNKKWDLNWSKKNEPEKEEHCSPVNRNESLEAGQSLLYGKKDKADVQNEER